MASESSSANTNDTNDGVTAASATAQRRLQQALRRGDVERVSWNTVSAAKIRGLYVGDHVIVFTPNVPIVEAPGRDATGRPIWKDPFECFCREIIKHSLFIKHVGYSAQQGMTRLHWEKCQDARAAIVFVAEPARVSREQASASLEQQARFALWAGAELRDQPGNLSAPPTMLVTCGDVAEVPQDEYGLVMHCRNYTRPVLEDAAELLFQH